MTVAYEERSQEDEHSCFADNTNADIIANALGVQRVYLGQYGDVSGPGIKDLIATEDEELAESLAAEINRLGRLARSIPSPSTACSPRTCRTATRAAVQFWTP